MLPKPRYSQRPESGAELMASQCQSLASVSSLHNEGTALISQANVLEAPRNILLLIQGLSTFWRNRMSPVKTPREAKIPSYRNSTHFLWENVLLFLSPARPVQLHHDQSKLNTKCCSFITGSRAPRSRAGPSFPKQWHPSHGKLAEV